MEQLLLILFIFLTLQTITFSSPVQAPDQSKSRTGRQLLDNNVCGLPNINGAGGSYRYQILEGADIRPTKIAIQYLVII